MVRDGTMPRPKRIRGRRVGWDVRELDAAIDELPRDSETQHNDTWGDVDAT
jgi:predicted DNA-binding transcriptional regulator AlpA